MSQRTREWTIVLGIGVVVAIALLVHALYFGDGQALFTDSDDAMHMVTATSLADGQAWYDTDSHRENTPFGAPMHFSRLIDAPLAALLTALRLFVGPGAAASDLTALVYPMLLIPILLAVCFALSRRLVPGANAVICVVAPLLSAVVLVEFAPGRVDHHNVQMMLTAGLALATIAGRADMRAAIAAGVLAALSIGVGAETFHLVALSIAIFGVYWAFDPGSARQVRGFAMGLAAAGLAIFVTTISPSNWLKPACDAFSLSYLVALFGGAAALLISTALDRRILTPRFRLAVLAALGTLAGAVTLLVSPQCVGGPYAAVDPAMMKAFLATVTDAQPAWHNFVRWPVPTFLIIGVPVIELAVGCVIACRATATSRLEWLVLLAFLALSIAVSLVQLRGARLAVLYGVPVAVYVIDLAWHRYRSRGGVPALLAFALSFVPFAAVAQVPIAIALKVRPLVHEARSPRDAAPGGDHTTCNSHVAFAQLAALPPSRVMAPIGLAADVLYFTPHTVVGTGFHRNTEGMADNMAFFSGGEAVARAIAERRGLGYMVLCGTYEAIAPGGFTPDSLLAGTHYDWLVPLSRPADPVQIYRIDLPAPGGAG